MERRLKVEGLPAGIKVDRLKFFFTNKRKCGGGPLENIDLSEDSRSAVITFQESNVVDSILQQGNSFQLMDTTIYVSRLKDEKVKNQYGIQEDNNNGKAEADIITRQLKVESLPDGIKADRLRFFFMNKNKSGGGPIEKIDLDEESRSAVITFKKSDAVDGILNRGNSFEIMEQTIRVSRLIDEKTFNQKETQEGGKNGKNTNTEADIITRQLKVESLPDGIKADRLRFFFMNKNKSGGGPIQKIDLHEDSRSAVITFKKSDAVDGILNRGNSFEIMDKTIHVSRLRDENTYNQDDSQEDNKNGKNSKSVDDISNRGNSFQLMDKAIDASSLRDKNTYNQDEPQEDDNNEKITKSELDTKQFKTRKLKVEGLPQNTTEDRLKYFFMNKHKSGGGPVKHISLSEDSRSAVITFENTDSVDRVLGHHKSPEIGKTIVSVSALEEDFEDEIDENKGNDEENSDKKFSKENYPHSEIACVNNQKTHKKKTDKMDDSSGDENDGSHAGERVSDIVDDSEEEENHSAKKEMRKAHDVDGLSEDESNVNYVVRRESGNKNNTDEDEDHDLYLETREPDNKDNTDEDETHYPYVETREPDNKNNTDEDEDHDLYVETREPDNKDNTDENEDHDLYVETREPDNQDNTDEDEDHDLYVETREPDNKDNTEEDENQGFHVERGKPDNVSAENKDYGPPKGMKKSGSMNNEALNISANNSLQNFENLSSDGESFIVIPRTLVKKEVRREKVNELHLTGVAQKKEGEEGKSHQSSHKDDDDPLLYTVKANIIDATKPKHFYTFYLEDGELGSLLYDEDSMILDGLNSCLYITFRSEKDAVTMCQYNHKAEDDSNILSVEMTSGIDSQFYSDKISVHGLDFTESDMKKKLCDFVTEKTDMCPVDVLLGEEPRSAIIKFKVEGHKTISDATWKCAKKLDDVLLITAPVPKSKSLLVLSDLSDIEMVTIKRYFSIKKRSGGGPCTVEPYDNGVKVIFKTASDQENVMSKANHQLGEVNLILSPFYFCLTKAAYMHKDVPNINSEDDSDEKSIDSDKEEMTVAELIPPHEVIEVSNDDVKAKNYDQTESETGRKTTGTSESYMDRTVKVNIIDVTQSKDNYVLYFEDDSLGSFTFDEKDMILDGLNCCLYVTFSTKEDASAVCHFNHNDEEGSNISSIEMVSAENLQIYPDRISVHGLDFTVSGMKEKLCDFVKKRTKISPTDILLGEDPNSAIVLFPVENLSIISEATWKCAKKLDNVLLTTAPVPKSKSLYVLGDLTDVDFTTLKRYFTSKRRSGGGPCSVEKYRNGAKVDFENISDQESVLRRGNHKVADVELKVSSFHQYLCRDKGTQKKHKTGNIDTDNSKESFVSEPFELTPASSDQPHCETDKRKRRGRVEMAKKPENPSPKWENPLHCTVRVHVIDTTRSKDAYMLYFEEEKFSSYPFDEKSMILDGLNKCIYVTFSTKEDASAMCQFKHEDEEDSNISSIEMASSDDLLFYSDMISVHGLDFAASGVKEKLCTFIQEKTKDHPVDILLGEETRSAIIKFASQDFNNISDATWTCAKKLDNVLLTTAPVPKSKSVFVSEGATEIDKTTLKRYFTNKKRSGGGQCSVETYNNGAKVNFDNVTDQENVLKQSNHKLGEVHLKLIPYHFCLSKAAYKHEDYPRVDRQSNSDEKLSAAQVNKSDVSKEKKLRPAPLKRLSDGPNETEKPIEERRKKRDWIREDVEDSSKPNDQLGCTVKINIIDVNKSKDDYELYFEDINFKCFDDKTMILDGLNQCLYVTFSTKKDASAVCQFNHKEEDESNISSIEIVSDEDLHLHSDLISVHGPNFTASGMKEKLCEFIEKKTKIKPVNILLGEEPRSAIVMFPDQDLTNSTWKCAKEFEGVILITAPVFKTRSVLVTGDVTEAGRPSLRRYFCLPKRSGGGPCSIKVVENGLKVTFENQADQENVLKKGNHKIGDVDLKLSSFHYCLSKAAYNDKVAPKVVSRSSSKEKHPKVKIAPRKSAEATSPSSNQQPAQMRPTDSTKPVIPDMLKSQKESSRCTIKAKIYDVSKHKEFYTLYFQTELCIQSFVEKDIILDGLKRSLYVTFENSKDAETLLNCKADDLRENNIMSVEKVSAKDMQFYMNVFSIHGVDFTKPKMKDRLQTFIEHKTGLKHEIIFGEEPRSAIIQFYKEAMKDNIYQLAWKCAAEMDNARLITAPVSFSSTLLIVGDLTTIETKTMERWLSSDRNGGGPVLKCERFQDKFLVTFKDPKDCSNVIKKGRFSLYGKDLMAKEYCPCLSQRTYQEFLKSLPPELETLREQHVRPVREYTKKIQVTKFKEYSGIILTRTSLEKDCLEKCPTAVVSIDTKSCVITIQAETDEDLKSVQSIVTNYKTKLNYSPMNDLDKHLHEYLSTSNAETIINSIFENENIAACLGNSKLYYYENVLKANEVIQQTVNTEFKGLSRPQTLLLQSEKSKKLMNNLQKQEGYLIKLGLTDGIKVSGLRKETKICMEKIEQYLLENHMEEEQVSFSWEKFQFIKQFCTQGLDKLETDAQVCGGSVELKDEGIVLKGPTDFTDKAKTSLQSLRDKIHSQEEDVSRNGIEEYLNSEAGTAKLNSVSDKCKCLIYLKGHNVEQVKQADRPQPKLVGTCAVDDKKVNFYLGNFCFLSVDVIVSVVDEHFTLAKTKQVLSNGGNDLRKDLQRLVSQHTASGAIIETQSGNLPCTKVFHILLDLDMDESKKKDFVTSNVENCLKKADRLRFKKIALPLIGCDEFGMDPTYLVGWMKSTVKKSLNDCQNLDEVILCDTKPDNVIKLMEKFDNVKEFEKLTPTDKPKTRTEKNTINIGPVTVTVKKGNLLKEKCDAIACGIKEDADLNRSGGVAKGILSSCGEGIQSECSNKAPDLAANGVILTSASNLPCANVIHVNMSKYSHRWDQGVAKVLQMADDNNFKSVALPGFGAGSRSADHERVKRSIMKGVKDFSSSQKNLQDVRLIISSNGLFNAFQDQESASKDEDSGPSGQELSSKATVIFCADKVERRRNAMKMLTEELSHVYYVKRFNAQGLEFLRESQIKTVVARGAQLQTKVEISDNILEMSGFKCDCFGDILQRFNSLVEQAKENRHRADLRSVSTLKTWSYMVDEKWKKFDRESNVKIEAAYMQHQGEITVSDSKGHKYIIDFQEMKEYTSLDGIKRGKLLCEVKRAHSGSGGYLPKRWEKMEPTENLKLVDVQAGGPEFQEVEKNFRNGGATAAIKKIERIQNKALYQQYLARKKALDVQNPQGHENEKRLFHGTDSKTVTLIKENGFNRGYCGKNATAYGDGVYFAVNSSYSVNYAAPDGAGDKRMFQVRVLVGVSTPSQSGMKVLPIRPGTNIPYDSGSANNMFIIFHDAQAYPEYIITF